MQKHCRLSASRIEAARHSINPVFLDTPQFFSDSLGALLGVDVLIKVETLNPIRCFKGRGSDALLARIATSFPKANVVCASAGNFGQAIAFSARRTGITPTVFAATSANPLKLERMRALGADVRLSGDDFDEAKSAARTYAAETGALWVEDSLDVETAEGAGTIGLELLRDRGLIDTVLIPLGNGALLTGIGCILKTYAPEIKVVAVQAEGASAMTESWRTGQLVVHHKMNTICDGIATKVPIEEVLDDMRAVTDDALLVSDDATVSGMQVLFEHCGLVVEPSAAVGVAALIEHHAEFKGQRVAVIACGGNISVQQHQLLLGNRSRRSLTHRITQ